MDYPSHKNYEKHPGRLERTTEAFRFPGTVTNRTSAAGEILPPFLRFKGACRGGCADNRVSGEGDRNAAVLKMSGFPYN